MVNMYSRQENIHLATSKRIAIVGCGGVGSWTALFAANIGIRTIHIFDYDKLEVHNLNRTPFFPDDVGKLKIDAMRNVIKMYRPRCLVIGYDYPIKADTVIPRDIDSVIDCTDNLASQRNIEKLAKESNMEYIRAGYDVKDYESIVNVCGTNAKIWDNVPEEVGYSTPPAPSFVIPAAIAGALAVFAVVKNIKPNGIYQLEKLVTSEVV